MMLKKRQRKTMLEIEIDDRLKYDEIDLSSWEDACK